MAKSRMLDGSMQEKENFFFFLLPPLPCPKDDRLTFILSIMYANVSFHIYC